jgi:hypothetical protein
MGKYIQIGRAYISWQAMHDRCYNKKSSSYNDYGGRGIKVCEQWHSEEGFDNFIENMSGKPAKDFSLDRINVNGDYEPANCRWADNLQQANNRRDNHFIVVNGEKGSISEMARKYNMNKERIRYRLKRGWSPEDACIVQTNKRKSNDIIVTYKGVSKRLSEYAKDYGVGFSTLKHRLKIGWTVEKTLTTPVKKSKIYIVFGETGTLIQLARKFNSVISAKSIEDRIRRGWSIEDAFSKPLRK